MLEVRRKLLYGLRRLPSITGRFYVSAAAILFLSMGVLWGIWRSMDLPPADTSYYFQAGNAWRLWGSLLVPGRMAFSPLYCVFFGIVQRAFSDAGDAVIIHRILILLVTTVAVLAVLRNIVPRMWAWLGAAWWIALPTNWKAFFEVHLFGFALTAVACTLAGSTRSKWGRGAALAVLSAAALFVRNELFLAAALFGLCCILSVWKDAPRDRVRSVVALMIPGIIAMLAIAWMFSGEAELVRWKSLKKGFESRQRLNLQQVYAFGYQQRHSDWTGSPWKDGVTLMHRDFRRSDPTFMEAFRANPSAMIEHCLWNFRLAPAGLQLGLFGGYSGGIPPDFAPRSGKVVNNPVILTGVVLILWLIGGILIWRRYRVYGLKVVGDSRAVWTWIFLLCCVPTSLVSIGTQHPRPSYIFSLTLLLMAFTLVCARLVVGELRCRFALPPRTTTWLALGTAIVLLVFLPGINWPSHSAQTIVQDYRRLRPFQQSLAGKKPVFCADTEWTDALANYLSIGGKGRCQIADWPRFGKSDAQSHTFGQDLDELRVTALYLKKDDLADPRVVEWRATAPGSGWKVAGAADNGDEDWEFWIRSPGGIAMAKPLP